MGCLVFQSKSSSQEGDEHSVREYQIKYYPGISLNSSTKIFWISGINYRSGNFKTRSDFVEIYVSSCFGLFLSTKVTTDIENVAVMSWPLKQNKEIKETRPAPSKN